MTVPGRTADRMLAGFAAVDVTPPGPLVLSGFAARASRSEGVNDRLCARAMAVAGEGSTPLVVITLDVIGVAAELTQRIALALSRSGVYVGPDRIAVVATHTHSGPATLPRAFLGQVDGAVIDRLVAGAVAAAGEAMTRLEPGEFRFGSALVPGIAVNRRDPAGPVDDELTVLGFWRENAAVPSGMLVSFALHPVVLGPSNLLVTRDYVGFVVDELAAAFPGAVPLYACGFAGQINHDPAAVASASDAPVEKRGFAVAAAIGQRLAAAARAAIASSQPSSRPAATRVAGRRLRLPLLAPAEASAVLLKRWQRELAAATPQTDPWRRAILPELIGWAKAHSGVAAPAEVATTVAAFGLADFALLFAPGEPFVEYALELKRDFPGKVMPLGFCNDAPGYLPTADAMSQGGYEVDMAYMFYGMPGRFAPELEDLLRQAMNGLVREVLPS